MVSEMISGKKIMKIGWYMLAVPLIALFLSLIISAIVSGSENAVNPVTRLVGMILVFCWAISLFVLVIGLVIHLVQKAAKRRASS